MQLCNTLHYAGEARCLCQLDSRKLWRLSRTLLASWINLSPFRHCHFDYYFKSLTLRKEMSAMEKSKLTKKKERKRKKKNTHTHWMFTLCPLLQLLSSSQPSIASLSGQALSEYYQRVRGKLGFIVKATVYETGLQAILNQALSDMSPLAHQSIPLQLHLLELELSL